MIDLIVQCFHSPSLKSGTHLLVALALARRCGDVDGVCFAKQATLAADTRLHQKTIAKVLSEFESEGIIERVKYQPLADGTRVPDDIYLTLPAVTLPETGSRSKGVHDSRRVPISHGVVDAEAMESSVPKPGSQGLPKKRPLKKPMKETNARDARGASLDGIEIDQAVAVIWAGAGEQGRKRSTKEKIKTALTAALKRRPKGVCAEDHLKRILMGLRAYLGSHEATKDKGQFEKGTHRILEGDVWETWLDDDAARAGKGVSAPVDPALGTMEEPGPKRQRMWMDLFRQGMTWDPDRGPRPGERGCRVDPALQVAAGVIPFMEGEELAAHEAREAEKRAFIDGASAASSIPDVF